MPRENENLTDGLVYIGLNEIEALIDRAILLGSPGIGKTEKIRQLAVKEAETKGRKFIDLRNADDRTLDEIIRKPEDYYVFYRVVVSHIMPEDLSVPLRNDKYVSFIPPKVLYVMTLKGIEGVLFLDEITNVSRPDQLSVLFSIVYEKEISWDVKMSDGIKVIMAGNLPKSSSIANLLPDPLVSRSILFYVKPPTVEEWINYMYDNYKEHWETIIGSFLLFYPQFLYFDKYAMNDDSNDNDNRRLYEEYVGSGERLLNFATPRTWTNLSLRLYELKQKGISYKSSFVRALTFGSLGPYVSNHVYPVLAKDLDIERLLREINENPSVIKVYDATTKIIAASFLFSREEISAEALKELVNIDKEFLTIAVLSQPVQKRVLIAQKYPWLISKLSSNLAKYSSEVSRALKDVNRDMNVSLV